MSFKILIRFLGSRELSIGILIAAALYFFYLTLLWFLNMRPPAFYMVWVPVFILTILFLANVIISLFTRHYTYTGNIVFHAAFVIAAIGVGLSLVYRFEGAAVLTEGSVFWGEKGDYVSNNRKNDFDRLAPKVSFKLDKITPEYWGQRLHFTRLDGEVSYPAETLANKGTIKLNGGLTINGARVRHTGFGFAPEILVEDIKSGRISRHIAVINIFPPGSEDYLEFATGLGNYKMYIQVLTDPVTPLNPLLPQEGKDNPSRPPLTLRGGERVPPLKVRGGAEGGGVKGGAGGVIYNKSMNLVDPVFKIRITWLGQPLYEGILKRGEVIGLGDTKISFTGVKYWLAIEIVKDPGEMIVIIGLAAMAAGLLLRLLTPLNPLLPQEGKDNPSRPPLTLRGGERVPPLKVRGG